MTGLALFGKTRLAASTGLGLLGSFVVMLGLQGRTFVAPVVPWDITVLTSPLLPVVPAVVALKACEPVLVSLEATIAPRRVARLRALWGALLTLGLSVVSMGVGFIANALSLETQVPLGTLAMSFASFFAVGLLGSLALGADLGWSWPCALVTGLVFFGRDPDQQPRAWAWILHQPSAVAAWAPTTLLVCLAICWYGCTDTVGVFRSQSEVIL